MTTLIIPSTGQTIGAFEAERLIRQTTSCGPVINFEDFGYKVVFPTPQPTFDPITHFCRETAPSLSSKGTWEQQWEVVELEPEQVAANQAAAQARLIESVTTATQARLDDFAKTRNYDGILSACTYATSAIPKFQAEGQYCVNARDNTWATLYTIMGEVQAGTRPVPTGFADVEPLLPALTWPV